MSLSVGDHLVIKRNGKIIDPESEAYHEFEVMGTDEDGELKPYVASTADSESPYQYKSCYKSIRLRVVE